MSVTSVTIIAAKPAIAETGVPAQAATAYGSFRIRTAAEGPEQR